VLRDELLQLVPAVPPNPPRIDSREAIALPIHQRARLFVTRRSKAASLLYDSWGRLRSGTASAPSGDPHQDVIYRAPVDGDAAQAWEVTEALVKTLAADVAADGAEFWLVTLPTAAQADPSVTTRRATARHYGVESLSYADGRVRAFAERNNIRAISLVERLAEFSERNGVNLYGGYTAAVPRGFGHWNETGNATAAKIVSEKLCSQNETVVNGY